MENALEEVQQPGTLLTVAGAIMAVFYGLFAVLGLVGLAFGCLGGGLTAFGAMAEGDTGSFLMLGWQGWVLILSTIGTILYAVLAAAGIFIFQAGSSLKELRDLEKVRKGMMAAAAVPVVGLLTNIAVSIFSLSLCGIVTYTVPQLIVLGLGGAAAYLTNEVLQNEDIVARFT